MKKISRRKTLSHNEIENFLNDISDVSKSTPLVSVTNSSKMEDSDKHCHSKIDCTQSSPCADDWIREYCKVQFMRKIAKETNENVVMIGRNIFNTTQYKLIPTRLTHPESFPHPPESIESKKQLLLSLSPMLAEAEEQRMKDAKLCELYTKCKFGKGKGRYSSYEYIDLENEKIMDYKEYEKRYLEFVLQNKYTKNFENEKVSLLIPINASISNLNVKINDENVPPSNAAMVSMETTLANALMKSEVSVEKSQNVDQKEQIVARIKASRSAVSKQLSASSRRSSSIVFNPLNSKHLNVEDVNKLPDSHVRKSSTHSSKPMATRRITLSPATAKAMIFLDSEDMTEMDDVDAFKLEEPVEQTSNRELSSPEIDSYGSTNTRSSIKNIESMNLSKELDLILYTDIDSQKKVETSPNVSDIIECNNSKEIDLKPEVDHKGSASVIEKISPVTQVLEKQSSPTLPSKFVANTHVLDSTISQVIDNREVHNKPILTQSKGNKKQRTSALFGPQNNYFDRSGSNENLNKLPEYVVNSQSRAFERYNNRMEIARWKYHWELVSVEAAYTAASKDKF